MQNIPKVQDWVQVECLSCREGVLKMATRNDKNRNAKNNIAINNISGYTPTLLEIVKIEMLKIHCYK